MYEQRISGPKRREGGGGRAQRACNDAVGLTKLMHERVHHDLRESAYIMCVHEACEADHHESIGDARLIEVEAVKLQAGFPPSLQVRLSNNCSLWLTIRVCSAQMCVLGGGGTGGVEGKIWRGEANERSRPRATDPLVVGGGGERESAEEGSCGCLENILKSQMGSWVQSHQHTCMWESKRAMWKKLQDSPTPLLSTSTTQRRLTEERQRPRERRRCERKRGGGERSSLKLDSSYVATTCC